MQILSKQTSHQQNDILKPNPFLKGLPLIYYFSGIRKNDKAIRREVSLRFSSKETTRAFLYYPPGKNPGDLPGIFLPHGMNISGIDDIRVQNLARNLALSGYSVLTPEIPEVKFLKIDIKTIERIKNLFYDYYNRTEYHSKDKLSFFSVSFSGSMGLIAFSHDKIRDKIRSAMVIGCCSHFVDTYLYANQNFHVDNYACMILFYNFLTYLDKKMYSEIAHVLFEYAVDNSLHRTEENSVGAKEHKKLRPPAADFLNRLFQDEKFRSDVVYAIKDNLPPEIPRSFSPYYYLGDFKAPLSLLHGSKDPVISPEESRKIYLNLKNRNHPVYVSISDLITHGDQVPLYSQILGIPGVAKAFGFYFSHI